MKRILTALLICLFSAVALSQGVTKKDPFIGLDKKSVIAQFGQPSEITKDAKGQEILVYKRTAMIGGSSANSHEGFIKEQKSTYSFVLDKNGKVKAWKVF